MYSHRNDLLRIIIEEKKDDPSEEIHKVEDEVKASDPFKGFIHENEIKETNNKEPNNKPCKYHFKGFCKRGLSCKFYHSSLDCTQHMKNRKCLIS